MYFPKGFKINEAIELAELIDCAYAQFTAFEADAPWQLPAKYTILRELSYVYETRNPFDKRNPGIDSKIKKKLLEKRIMNIPIGFIARSKGTTFVIFRGTKTAQEWIGNFNTKLQEFFVPEFGNVHEGFLSTYLNIRESMLETLRSVRTKAVLIGGHSLGGAFATFARIDLAKILDRKVKALYTFGCPRIGDNSFVQRFNAAYAPESFRVANTSDIVTSLPLPIPLAGIVGGYFSHVDTPVDFTLQSDDVENNHHIKTYLLVLSSYRKKGIFDWLARR